MSPSESESRARRGVRPIAFAPVFALAVALIAGPLACGGDDTPAEPEAAPSAAKRPDAEPGQRGAAQRPGPAAAVPDPDLTGFESTLGDDAKIPEGFPNDLPIYPGARPTASMSAEGEGSLVTFDIDEGPEKVYDFYQQKLADGGWEISSTASMGGQWMISALKDERAAQISIAGSESGSQLGLAVAEAQ